MKSEKGESWGKALWVTTIYAPQEGEQPVVEQIPQPRWADIIVWQWALVCLSSHDTAMLTTQTNHKNVDVSVHASGVTKILQTAVPELSMKVLYEISLTEHKDDLEISSNLP